MTELIEVNVANLSGEALNWAVAKAEWVEYNPYYISMGGYRNGSSEWSNWNISNFRPSSDWSHCGPLIGKHRVSVYPCRDDKYDAVASGGYWSGLCETPLIAICRSVVKSKLGDTVQVPKELI